MTEENKAVPPGTLGAGQLPRTVLQCSLSTYYVPEGVSGWSLQVEP